MRYAALFLPCFLGCAASTEPTEGERTSAPIINGTETTGHPAIMAIYAKKPNEDKGALCTSTLISPTVLLTAAHCVSPEAVGDGAIYKAIRGSDITDRNNRVLLDIAQVHWDRQFSMQNPPAGHDIAVAILAQPITDAQPIPWNADALPSSVQGQPVQLVGYGLNDGFGQTGAGVKREASVPLNSFDNLFVKTGSFFGTTICSGDSGGPILAKINGRDTVIGVNSFGMIYCMGEASSTRVDTYRAFVEQYVGRGGTAPAPAPSQPQPSPQPPFPIPGL